MEEGEEEGDEGRKEPPLEDEGKRKEDKMEDKDDRLIEEGGARERPVRPFPAFRGKHREGRAVAEEAVPSGLPEEEERLEGDEEEREEDP